MGPTAAMTDERPAKRRYAIRLSAEIDERWAAWFDATAVRVHDDGTTTIEVPCADQAALHGALRRVRDLGVDLLSVVSIEDPPPVSPPSPR